MNDGLKYLGGHFKNDFQSIGLVFEPNFFTAYFYSDSEAGKPVAFQQFETHQSEVPAKLKSPHPAFALTFNTHWTLVPQSIFKAEDADTYLHFNTGTSKIPGDNQAEKAPGNHSIDIPQVAGGNRAEWDRLIGLESILIYEKDNASEKVLEKISPGLRLKHGIGALLEFCRFLHAEKKAEECFLHQSGNSFSLVVFNRSGLVFANSIYTKHDEDIRYFVLYSLKTLGLQKEVELYLLGEAFGNSTLTALLKNYLPRVRTGLPQSLPDRTEIDKSTQMERWPGIFARICAL